MSTEQQRWALIQELPEELQADAGAVREPYLRMAVDEGRTAYLGTVSVGYPVGLIQSPGTVAYTTRLASAGPEPLLSAEDAECVVRFREARRKECSTSNVEHIIADSALRALPPEVRREQLRHLLHMHSHTLGAWKPLYVPRESTVDVGAANLTIAFSPHMHPDSYDSIAPGSAYEEHIRGTRNESGVLIAAGATEATYHATDTPPAVAAIRRFLRCRKAALPLRESREALERMAGEAGLE